MTDNISSSSLADIAAASGHIGYQWDLKADHLIWVGPWQKLFGAERDHPPHNAETLAAVIVAEDRHRVFTGGTPIIDREYRIKMPDGRIVWVCEHATTSFDGASAVKQQGLIRIIDVPQRQMSAQNAMERDALTGKPNRAYMLAQVNRVLGGSTALKQLSAYLVVSVDKMSFINDALGTRTADMLLCGVAQRLGELVPTKAVLARVGGDMFGILLPGIGNEAVSLADRILHNFRDRPVAMPAAPVHVTMSIGGIRLTDSNASAVDLLIRAEQALHEAQQNGRNRYAEYQESAARSMTHRATLELGERVKRALKNDGLKLAYQPVVDTVTGDVLFYEALARLFGDDGNIILAADFIPVVELQGLAPEFDRHVLALAVKEMEEHPELRLAVNVSGLTASQSGWSEHIQRTLGGRGDLTRRLIIEITETAAVADVTETERFAAFLQRLGGQVALDDFGAGTTSIRHLRTLALTIMKIDRELFLNLLGNREQEHLVRMLVSIAHGFGLKVVAEGVETEDVAAWLRAENVDMMQGYYLGRPALGRPWIDIDTAKPHAPLAISLLGTLPAT